MFFEIGFVLHKKVFCSALGGEGRAGVREDDNIIDFRGGVVDVCIAYRVLSIALCLYFVQHGGILTYLRTKVKKKMENTKNIEPRRVRKISPPSRGQAAKIGNKLDTD